MTIRDNFEKVLNFLTEAKADAEMIEFVKTRIEQEEKARETAKAKRLEKNGGEKKDPSQSEFYTALRGEIYKVLSTDFQTGDELIAKANVKTPAGKPVLAAQVAMALKPLVADGTVITGEMKVSYTDKNNLTKETMRKAYRLA